MFDSTDLRRHSWISPVRLNPFGVGRKTDRAKKHGDFQWKPKSNFSIVESVSNLEPVLARILTALERHVDGERNGEIHEYRAIVAILDFHVSVFPADALN